MKQRLVLVLAVEVDQDLAQAAEIADVDQLTRDETSASAAGRNLSSDDERFLLLYFLTCPHNNSAGCFRLPDGYALHDLGWSQDRYDKARRSLLDAEMVDHDSVNEVVLIERWFQHNAPMNKSHRKGILSQLKKVPSDGLRDKAYAALEAVETGTGERKTDGGSQSPDKPGAHPTPSVGVTAAHLKTPYMTGARRL